MTTTPATEKAGALAPPVDELQATALTEWEGLTHRIAAAKQESATKVFDYSNKHDLVAARSWVASLRRIKGSIERARKNAKAIHLERGRMVDGTAKALEKSVAGLIEPHQDAINRIEAIEQARVDAHISVLDYIEGVTAGVTTSIQALERIEALEALDTSALEEFATAAANRAVEQIERLQVLYDQLLKQESDAAKLEALRQEKARREAEEAAEALRLEGERRAAARLAAERQEQAALDCQPEAGPDQEEALQQGVPAEGDYRDHSAILQRRSVYKPPAKIQAQEDPIDIINGAIGDLQERERHELALLACLKGKTGPQVAAELLDGTFHPAVRVDTSLL
jgi:hypothetical protein